MAVCGDIFLFSFCLLDTGGLIFILIYFIITLSDLECDYLNAQECCSKLNFVSQNFLTLICNYHQKSLLALQWNVPKLWCQLVILFIVLLGGHWLMFLINLPICIYLARRYYSLRQRFNKLLTQFSGSFTFREEISVNMIQRRYTIKA